MWPELGLRGDRSGWNWAFLRNSIEQGLYPSCGLLPDSCKCESQTPQHSADQSHHRVGLRERACLNIDLTCDCKADECEQQADAADGHRQIADRGCDRPCGGCRIAHAE